MDNITNLQDNLKANGLKPLEGAELKHAKKVVYKYLVLYTCNDSPEVYHVGHGVEDKHTVDCMVKWEIYRKVKVIDLSDSSMLLEQYKWPWLEKKNVLSQV